MQQTIDELRRRCAAIDAAELADLAYSLVDIWGPPGEESAVAERVRQALVAVGCDNAYLDESFPGSPSVICRLEGAAPGPTLQWHGHLDTISTSHERPRMEGDLIHGRGAADMRGALAAMVFAAGVLRAMGHPRSGDVLLTFHGLHEEGGSAPLIDLIRRGIVGDAVLIGELGHADRLITSSGGLSFWDLEITAEIEPVHETLRPPEWPDLTHHVGRALAALDQLHHHLSETGGSVFVGQVQTGDYYNRVPVRAHLAGTCRHTVAMDRSAVQQAFEEMGRAMAGDGAVSVSARFQPITDAYQIDADGRIAKALRSAVMEVFGTPMYRSTSRAVGNAAHFAAEAGVPAVYYGADYSSAHSDHEWVNVMELFKLVEVYVMTTMEFLDPGLLPAPPETTLPGSL